MKYVFDNSPLSELLKNCELFGCMKIFSKNNELLVPERVREEFLIDNPTPECVSILESEFCTISTDPEDTLLPYFNHDSTSGEFWVLSHGKKNPDSICVIDEGKARTVAKFENIQIIGTVKLLEIMRDENTISHKELENTKKIILNGNFRLSDELRQQLDSL